MVENFFIEWHKRKINKFDPYNVFLAFATNIPVLLIEWFCGLRSQIFAELLTYVSFLWRYLKEKWQLFLQTILPWSSPFLNRFISADEKMYVIITVHSKNQAYSISSGRSRE